MAVIGILLALILPAVQQARAAARRTECMNRIRNVSFAMISVVENTGRFPACGNFASTGGHHHSWVVDVLPWLEQNAVADKWDKDRPIDDPVNLPLTSLSFPVLTCPADISLSGSGDLSFVVNGGVGFTAYLNGMHDCPSDASWQEIDLNGNGVVCPPAGSSDGKPTDREFLYWMGLFFNETWDSEITRRHHRFATVVDGLSQTVMLSENVRTGYNPDFAGDPWESGWASPHPKLTSFYIGMPCANGNCLPGAVDYGLSNSGAYAINSGLTRPEGLSPVPNSFHAGGVNMAFADGRVQFVSESIDGGIYAAIMSPRGVSLAGTLLEQPVAEGY